MMNQNHSSGVLFGVGVGPGDPELRALKLKTHNLNSCDTTTRPPPLSLRI